MTKAATDLTLSREFLEMTLGQAERTQKLSKKGYELARTDSKDLSLSVLSIIRTWESQFSNDKVARLLRQILVFRLPQFAHTLAHAVEPELIRELAHDVYATLRAGYEQFAEPEVIESAIRSAEAIAKACRALLDDTSLWGPIRLPVQNLRANMPSKAASAKAIAKNHILRDGRRGPVLVFDNGHPIK